MNLYFIKDIQFVVAAFIFWLGLFVFKTNPRAIANRGFLSLALCSSLWLFFYGLAYFIDSKAVFFFKIGFSFVIFTGVGAYHFVLGYADLIKQRKILSACYLVGV